MQAPLQWKNHWATPTNKTTSPSLLLSSSPQSSQTYSLSSSGFLFSKLNLYRLKPETRWIYIFSCWYTTIEQMVETTTKVKILSNFIFLVYFITRFVTSLFRQVKLKRTKKLDESCITEKWILYSLAWDEMM